MNRTTQMARPLRNRDAADIYVDNPAKAMDQFKDGLRRVLAAPKPPPKPVRKNRTAKSTKSRP
jgi:hypothetical protein